MLGRIRPAAGGEQQIRSVYSEVTDSSQDGLVCLPRPQRPVRGGSLLHRPSLLQPALPSASDSLSQLDRDVFQLAPFAKTPARKNKLSLDSAFCPEAPDVFLRAPFVRRVNVTNASDCGACVGERPLEVPVLQQPVTVHRVVSRVGQQAGVGSVAVGPLHAWTVAGRPTEDPFTAAPFSPRCHQGEL
ncbi:hypothetical protein WMY93_024942 [Mugilogobius chulae]|uniref:BMP-2-inducible protein kinase C-terminal domain-containing protein n=1 Tax=Mugilogobius chulae TaxID=88201 RepID=A0AAW0N5G0_9GOBI